MARGAFIVLEGLDRSGKSTQLRRISEALRQRTGKEVSHGVLCARFGNRNTVDK